MLRLTYVLVLMSCAIITNAQTFKMLFKIDKVLDDNSFFLEHNGFTYEIESLQGEVQGIYKEGETDRNKVLGTAKLLDSNDKGLIFEWKNDAKIQIGDLIALNITIEKPAYENIFFHLALKNIRLTSVFGEPFIDNNTMLFNGRAYSMSPIHDMILEDMKLVAKEMRQKMDEPRIESGLYQGYGLFSAMNVSTMEDINIFLEYIEARPLKYQGREWKLSEIYATWLVSDSPIPAESLGLALSKAKSEERFNQILNTINKDNYSQYSEKLRGIANNYIKQEKYDDALKFANGALKLAQLARNETQAGWANFVKGGILRDLKQPDKAIEIYQKAIQNFQNAQQDILVMSTYNNLGMAYLDKSDFKNALKILELSDKMQQPYLEKAKTGSTFHITNALTILNIGKIYKQQKKYKKALKHFEKAIDQLENAKTHTALKRKTLIYFLMADTYKQKGNLTKYVLYQEMALDTYEKL